MSDHFAERAFSNNPSIRFKGGLHALETAAWFAWEEMAAPAHQRAKLST
jgi:hypothetical protein